MYYDIYITTMKSKALRGDPTRRIGKAEAFAAANLRPNGCAADPPFGDCPIDLGSDLAEKVIWQHGSPIP